jgi:hypothetical protein
MQAYANKEGSTGGDIPENALCRTPVSLRTVYTESVNIVPTS